MIDKIIEACARNRAITESKGQYVLFLDAALLASPRLIESHVRAQQQHGGKSAIVGNIGRHPQAESRARLAHFLMQDPLRESRERLTSLYVQAGGPEIQRELFL